ncbi:hypothetical protein N3K63_10395 [Microbacterium sp. W1N]|uniref:hypothetical protein n=1 Tax=Microbacterium festucae TaxID=2977531 RepID=UPI0021BE1F73|nr:hypothetical protein [Microbacterium festucae]MCT9820690.1 hypothetical protein [Microbacterium festucae]
MTTRPLALLGAALLLPALLAGCAATPATPPPPSPTAAPGHGAVAGAVELAEPALHLASISPDGAVHHLDLLDGESTSLGDIAPAATLDSEGRFLFAGRDGSVSIVDSGVWTWNHVDHFHYYEAPSRLLGELTGDGTPRTVVSDLGAGVHFDGGEAVLLDLGALKDGEIVAALRLEVAPGDGMIVPLPVGALVTTGEGLRRVDADGTARETIPCAAPQGSIATVEGVVVGCADGAVLVTGAGDSTAVERIPYPEGAGERAVSFAAREHRPTVAGVTGGTTFWMLDTRARTWTEVDAGEPLERVVAVDDTAGHVVALAADGAVQVFAGGAPVARTAPLVAASLADPALAAGVSLTVDAHRVYLNGPAERMLFELAPADGARIARTFPTGHVPQLTTETGR